MDKPKKDDLLNQMRFLVNDLISELNRLERENPTYQRVHDVESFFEYRLAQYQHHLTARRK
tara:strand:+ start:345 stop:527 length:183 start_codon:yes stop_codon:yes gene_type:complete